MDIKLSPSVSVFKNRLKTHFFRAIYYYYFFFFCIILLCILSFFLSIVLKTDSVQSSSNTCKNYLLKIYSQHGNFLNDCILVLLVTPRLNPQAFSRNLMSNFVRMLKASVIGFTTNAKRPF